MSDIQQLSIKRLLSGDSTYIVPMYQRNYAWEEAEIGQLIQDIADTAALTSENTYYLGTLVVDTLVPGRFETIDGQQRLTTLCLLAAYLKHKAKEDGRDDFVWFARMPLSFESRKKSEAALARIFEVAASITADTEEMDAGIYNGYRLIQRLFPVIVRKEAEANFISFFLKHVDIMRVTVPPATNLNRYFEIMNSRGEQLEKHEVLKAKMLSVLPVEDRHSFSTTWDACANMHRYVQMSFEDKPVRDELFGQNWDRCTARTFDELRQIIGPARTHTTSENTLDEILNATNRTTSVNQGHEDESPERFRSVINFQNFLLHTLRIQYPEANVPLDDKKLLDSFQAHALGSADAVRKFAVLLLKCRFLFDHFVIKQEAGSNQTWSLRALKRARESADYENTFSDSKENRRALMLLAAFHVSNPSTNYKYWLNAALRFLAAKPMIDGAAYIAHMERGAAAFAFRHYLAPPGSMSSFDEILSDTECRPHPAGAYSHKHLRDALSYPRVNVFIFNYLDYLLWLKRDGRDQKIEHFRFSPRSSVEHHLPQNPLNKDAVAQLLLHTFGNLCIVTPSKNSLLNARSPEEKKKYYSSQDAIDSIKQKLMMDETPWNAKAIYRHGVKMIKVLRDGPPNSVSTPEIEP